MQAEDSTYQKVSGRISEKPGLRNDVFPAHSVARSGQGSTTLLRAVHTLSRKSLIGADYITQEDDIYVISKRP